MLTRKIILTGLFVIGCLCIAGFPGSSLAKDKSDANQKKENTDSQNLKSKRRRGSLKMSTKRYNAG